MKIDREVEGRTRDMLGHAMRGEVEDIPPILQDMKEDQIRECLSLCVLISGYIAIDVCRSQWPGDSFLRRIAEKAVESESELNLEASQVYDFLSRSALRFEPVDKIFTDPTDAIFAPIMITGSLLLTFTPKEKNQWEWLDQIEAATEAAAGMKPYMYPAVVLRSQIPSGS